MARRQYWAILDTETTIQDTVCDIGIIVVDRTGKIYNQMGVLVSGHYNTHELFHDKNANDIWGYSGLIRRKENYIQMLNMGNRMLASVAAINKWINLAVGKYNPTLTAYNLSFDKSKCLNTGIDLSAFNSEFCLWQAAIGNICSTRNYRQFCLQNHGFNAVTQHGNMTYKTNAEMVCGYIKGEFVTEPHTALEDARDFELPILTHILKRKDWQSKVTPYNWKSFQVRDHFKV